MKGVWKRATALTGEKRRGLVAGRRFAKKSEFESEN